MDILMRFALAVLGILISLVFLGTALIWFVWIFSRSHNGW